MVQDHADAEQMARPEIDDVVIGVEIRVSAHLSRGGWARTLISLALRASAPQLAHLGRQTGVIIRGSAVELPVSAAATQLAPCCDVC